MDPWQLIATVLWTGFGLSIIASAIAVLARAHFSRSAVLAVLGAATAYLLYFSFLAGFSIGPGTVLIPAVLTALAVSLGRGARATYLSVAIALIAYVALSVLPLFFFFRFGYSPILLIFTLDSIPWYTAAAIAGFTWSALNPPKARAETHAA